MFEYLVSFLTSRSAHPFIASLFLLAAVFAVAGVFVETVIGNGTAGGFLVIYAMMATVLGVLGYAALYTLRLASIIRERTVLT